MPSRPSRIGVMGALLAVALAGAGCGGAGRPSGLVTSPPSPDATWLPASPSPTPAPTTPPPTATPAPPPPSPTATPAACTTAGVLANWSVQRLAEQTVVVPVDESTVAGVTAEVAAGAGGVLLMGTQAPAGLAASLQALASQAPGGVAPLVMTDEEGGAIQRMANLVGSMPSARDMAATMSPAQIQALVTQVAQRMRNAGVTMDLAPVLDLDGGDGPSDTDPDGTRSFSLLASVASADGLGFARGLEAGGVIPAVKHFPGLGQATANTDVAPASTLPWSTLQTAGLLPFRDAVRAGIPAVMIANAGVPGLTALPASLAPNVITGVLRTQLGFHGLVLTDSLSAKAISAAGYAVPQAAVAALNAGADMVLFNGKPETIAALTAQTVQAVVAAVQSGALSRGRLQDAVLHVLAAKHLTLCG